MAVVGTAAGAGLVAIPASLDFYSQAIGAPDTATALLLSTGSDTLHLSQVAASDSRFAVDRDSVSLPPGDSADLTVVYTPSDGSAAVGQLTFESRD